MGSCSVTSKPSGPSNNVENDSLDLAYARQNKSNTHLVDTDLNIYPPSVVQEEPKANQLEFTISAASITASV